MMSKFSEKELISQKFNNPEEEKKNIVQNVGSWSTTLHKHEHTIKDKRLSVNDPIGFPNWLSMSSSTQTLFQKMPIDNYMYEVQYMHF